jgi:hypothetical protein
MHMRARMCMYVKGGAVQRFLSAADSYTTDQDQIFYVSLH